MYKKKDTVIFVLICSYIVLFNSLIIEAKANYTPKVIMDLREFDLSDNVITLDGKWEFYCNQLLEPDDFLEKNDDFTGIVSIPGAWNGYEFEGERLSSEGYATYRVLLKMDKEEGLIGLKIPRILTAYRMWVNDMLIASAGEIGQSRKDMTPQYLPQIAFFPSEEEVEVIIQVANFYHRSGGILESIIIGTEEDIISLNNKRLAYDLFLFGCLLIMAIYHLIIFLYRKKEYALLYFGIFCLLISTRTLLVGEIFFIKLFPNFSWEIAHKGQTLSYYFGVYIFLLFFRAVFPDYFKSKIIKISQV